MSTSFSLSSEKSEGVLVFKPKGKVTIGVGEVALGKAVHDAIESGTKRIVIDLSDVTVVDSASFGEFVSIITYAMNREVLLVFSNPSPKVREILHITQLINAFPYTESLEEAVDAVKDIKFKEFLERYGLRRIEGK
jgi:anti-sigma B factor antagonist